MKKLRIVWALVIAVVVLAVAVPAVMAADTVANGTAGDGITWTLDSDGLLTVSGNGEIVVDWYSPPWLDYSSEVKTVVVSEGITKFPDFALYCSHNLVSVSLPSTVTEIGSLAFDQSNSLERIEVSADNNVYKSEDGIVFSKDGKTLVYYPSGKEGTSYTIPSSVTTVAEYAFGNNQLLETVTVPDTVTSIENRAFCESALKSVSLGNGITELSGKLFEFSQIKDIIIPDTVKTINEEAFWNCSKLNYVTIGAGVESIVGAAFGECDALYAIHYIGTQEQWDMIEIGEYSYSFIENTPIHFLSDSDYGDGNDADCLNPAHSAGYYCDVCEVYATGKATSAPLGHSWSNGVCGRCALDCGHAHYDTDGKCDICSHASGVNVVKLGETYEVYIPEADKNVFVKFVPEENGKYYFTSDNGGNDNEIDPYITVYDSDMEQIEYDDDDDFSYNFDVAQELEAGDTYYLALSAYEGEVTYKYSVSKFYEISSQPTTEEPIVKLNWNADATYQWYKTDIETVTVTDQNAAPIAAEEGGTASSYNSETGWTGSTVEYSNEKKYCELVVSAEDVVVVNVIGADSENGCWIYMEGKETGTYVEEYTSEDGVAYLYPVVNDTYTIYSYGVPNVTIQLIDYTYTIVDGAIKPYLINADTGDTYACEVTVGKQVLMSDVFEAGYGIVHQPTMAEPYVTPTISEGTKYQWYSAHETPIELTSANTDIVENEYGKSSYNAGAGWAGVRASEGDDYDFFAVELKKGESITVELIGEYYDGVGLWDYSESDGVWADYDGSTKYTLTAEWDGEFTLYTYLYEANGATVKAYGKFYGYTILAGETNATLKTEQEGLYVCDVTFSGGKMITSAVMEIFPAWNHDGIGWYCVDENGNRVTNRWVKDSVGWCYVGADGYCITNAWMADSVGWCYLDAEGRMVTNEWVRDSVGWCYVGAHGYCLTNTWMEDINGWCYLDANGRMVTGTKWIYHNNGWYYLENNYRVEDDWRKDSIGWCYLGMNGRMLINEIVPDSVGLCYVGADGYCVTNSWIYYDNEIWIYTDSEGRLVSEQWVKDSIGWCYIGEEYMMVTNAWVEDTVGICYIGADGYCVTNDWVYYDESWYFVDENGYRVHEQWRLDSVGWCYLGEDGKMLTNSWVKDSVGWCWLGESGYWDGKYHTEIVQ